MTFLLILDMNATMGYRAEGKLRGINHDCDLYHSYFYLRPDIETFLSSLSSTGMFTIAVYSSFTRQNITETLQTILPNWRKYIECIFDREMTKKDPQGGNYWDAMRDMSKIWSKHPGYDEKNTIILDNEYEKIREFPLNGIVVPAFGQEEVKQKKANLGELLSYLLKISVEDIDDIREYMSKNPFSKNGDELELTKELKKIAIKGKQEKKIDFQKEASSQSIDEDTCFYFKSYNDGLFTMISKKSVEQDAYIYCGKLLPQFCLKKEMKFKDLKNFLTDAKLFLYDSEQDQKEL